MLVRSELNSIFSQYAKSGTAGAGSMTALTTIQSTEFTTLCLDCGYDTGYRTRELCVVCLRALCLCSALD